MLALEITSRPIQWEFEIEPAQLKMRQADNPAVQLDFKPHQLNIDSKNISVRLDGTDLRASLEHRKIDGFIYQAAQKGKAGAQAALEEAVDFGNQVARIEDGVTIAQIVQQKMLEQKDTYTFFIPEPYNISWQPNEQSISFEPADVEIDWQTEKNLMDFVPGSFTINIIQRPEVDIKYVGKPIYVPPSSAPDFEAVV